MLAVKLICVGKLKMCIRDRLLTTTFPTMVTFFRPLKAVAKSLYETL